MRTLIRMALICGALACGTQGAYAANDAVSGISIAVRSAKDNSLLMMAQSDEYGQINLGNMKAGSYVIEVAGSKGFLDVAANLNKRQKSDLKAVESTYAAEDSQIVLDIKRRGDAEGVSIFRYYDIAQAATGFQFDFNVSPEEEAASRFLFMMLTVKDALAIDVDLSC